MGKLTPKDKLQLKAIEKELPQEYREDWLSRRKLNHAINVELTRIARQGKFHYLAIGKDDNATLSATHMEARQLSLTTFEVPATTLHVTEGTVLGVLIWLGLYWLTYRYYFPIQISIARRFRKDSIYRKVLYGIIAIVVSGIIIYFHSTLLDIYLEMYKEIVKSAVG